MLAKNEINLITWKLIRADLFIMTGNNCPGRRDTSYNGLYVKCVLPAKCLVAKSPVTYIHGRGKTNSFSIQVVNPFQPVKITDAFMNKCTSKCFQ